jgi:opacity protein-like surface antigen
MKHHYLAITASSLALAASAFAGVPSKEIAPPEPIYYGTGFYFGLQAGVNAFQDFGGTRRLELGDTEIAVEPREKVGFVGGIKLGYVFGTDTVRPAIELDGFYNGLEADLDGRVNGEDTEFNAQGKLHSGALLANFILRFAFDRFQPYIGAGIGGYYAESQDVEVTVGNRHFEGGGGNNSGLAWQIIGGADYYLSEKTSIFAEYKFLNYEDAGFNENRIGQHIAVLGVRWHF